jgi:DNA-binding response OmpR family regulator
VFTGEEAIKEAIKNKPDLILMDIQLRGDIDGVEAATKIGQQLNIPVIYLTAHGENAILERAKITEPNGYLIKPFNEIELRSALEMALYKHEAERKIRESEEKFRELFNKACDAIFIFDLEGHIKEINQEAIDRLKYNRQELLAMKIFDLQPQDSNLHFFIISSTVLIISPV